MSVDEKELKALILRSLDKRLGNLLSDSEKEDVIAATLERVSTRFPDMDSSAKARLCRQASTWIGLDRLRQRAQYQRVLKEYARRASTSNLDDGPTLLAKKELRSLVMQALADSLSAKEGMIVYARFFCDKTLGLIADELGMSIGAVHAHLNKALIKLAERLQEYRDLLE